MSEPAEKVNINDPVDADDDLDELDDVLSEFTPTSASTNSTAASESVRPSFGRKRTNTRVDQAPVSIPGSGTTPGGVPADPASKAEEDLLSDEFTKELAKNMEQLMKELVIDNSSEKKDDGEKDDDLETQKMFKAAWEAMLIEGMNGMVPEGLDATGNAAAGPSEKATGGGGDFQSRIKQTMDKMKENESSFKPDSAAPDSLEQLLASLGDLGLDGADDGELDGLLENVMGQIMSKEILYPPLKELAENFPPYLAQPPEPLTPADKTRYEAQLVSVKKILAVFDKPEYDDKDPAASKQIVSLMEELQSHGSPPEAVMGPLPPGMNFGADGMPEGCTIA